MADRPTTPQIDVAKLKPSYCVWELTLACNLRCGHCGSRAGKARPDELSTAECLGVVDSLAGLGCRVITLSGGEPTLRPDWDVIASAIRDRGMIPNMVTNGYVLDQSTLDRMKGAGLANVAVSIDGPEEIHDQIRGIGTYRVTSGHVRKLVEAGISVTVMTTINTLNMPRLEDTYLAAVELGAEKWRCQLGKPMGHMKTNDELVIKPKDLLRLLPELYRLGEEGEIKVGIGDSIGYYGPYDSQLRARSWEGLPQCWGGCQAGLRAIGVEADGGIKGCLSMQAFGGGPDPFLEGNIRKRSLEDIWTNPNGFAYNRQHDQTDLTGFCRKCSRRVQCRGGARCVAAAATGGVSEDPYCYHRVATLATNWPTRVIGKHIATAASVASLVLAGCATYSTVEPEEPDCAEVAEQCDLGDLPADVWEACCAVGADYGVEPPNCQDVCCECDYGVLPEGVYENCCAVTPDYGVEPDPCADVCCSCEYGVLPPEVLEQCCDQPPPINCSEVCCECDYGELPPEVWETCCNPVPSPEYGVEPPDCSEVCCDCDYGELPPGVWEDCCVATPDYGTEPPELIDCTEVCCECDYGELPPEVAEACCDGKKKP